MKDPISNTVSGGPCWNEEGPVLPPRPPLNPPLPLFILNAYVWGETCQGLWVLP